MSTIVHNSALHAAATDIVFQVEIMEHFFTTLFHKEAPVSSFVLCVTYLSFVTIIMKCTLNSVATYVQTNEIYEHSKECIKATNATYKL